MYSKIGFATDQAPPAHLVDRALAYELSEVAVYDTGREGFVELNEFFQVELHPRNFIFGYPKIIDFWRRNAICQAYHFWICMLNFWGVLVSRVNWAVFSLLPRVKTSGLQIVSVARKLNGLMD